VICLSTNHHQPKTEPPAGAAPAGILYKRNPQAAAWRRAKLNSGSLLNASPSKDKATGFQNNDGCDVARLLDGG